MATPHPINDSKYYIDTGATHHIIGDLKNLTINSPNQGLDSVQVGNGEDLVIKHIESSNIPTSSNLFMLNNILHYPNALANLL